MVSGETTKFLGCFSCITVNAPSASGRLFTSSGRDFPALQHCLRCCCSILFASAKVQHFFIWPIQASVSRLSVTGYSFVGSTSTNIAADSSSRQQKPLARRHSHRHHQQEKPVKKSSFLRHTLMVIGYSAAKLVNISETTKQKQSYFPVLSEILWFDNRIVVVMLPVG